MHCQLMFELTWCNIIQCVMGPFSLHFWVTCLR